MPLTLEAFLAAEPTLQGVRQEQEQQHDARERHDLALDEAALVHMLTRRWDQGVVGWMTAGEATLLAVELEAEAEASGVVATARVEERIAGSVSCEYLVFAGGAHGQHLLRLPSSSPVRARRAWAAYLLTCPLRRGGTER